MAEHAISLIVMLIGAFSFYCAYKNFDWFFDLAMLPVFITVFFGNSRKVGRIFHMVLGLLLAAAGATYNIIFAGRH